ncbi:IucA/IucC family C-terminal-domain containing protein [Paenibacillus sp. Aloe-11]|uniref:IucA/IucC family C-terminal-domain containing protein n=1 Tax=Paenibacillus sp. Aloe-11 TaxID=1050222 RepID=UPI00024EFB11|nr:IucA/IucC family C-terminal-domain containing protein [Paenibacillus sp. Aloe-11]EHS57845.1 FhuF/siderophore biosynthesis protein [Paenibacillus sp. Aloe-11]
MPYGKTSSFEPAEWSYLTDKLRISSDAQAPTGRYDLPAADLLDASACTIYLDRLSELHGFSSRKVTASALAKRYGFLIVSPALYAMSVYNKTLGVGIADCTIRSDFVKDTWLPRLHLNRLRVSEYNKHTEYGGETEHGDRDNGDADQHRRHAWRDYVIGQVFAEHLAPIWRSVSAVASIPRTVLWENTAIYVYALYENRIRQELNGGDRLRIEEDFKYLICEAPAYLFGERHNPLARYAGSARTQRTPMISVSTTSMDTVQAVRVRKTCCYFYQMKDKGSYCPTCPKIHGTS